MEIRYYVLQTTNTAIGKSYISGQESSSLIPIDGPNSDTQTFQVSLKRVTGRRNKAHKEHVLLAIENPRWLP